MLDFMLNRNGNKMNFRYSEGSLISSFIFATKRSSLSCKMPAIKPFWIPVYVSSMAVTPYSTVSGDPMLDARIGRHCVNYGRHHKIVCFGGRKGLTLC